MCRNVPLPCPDPLPLTLSPVQEAELRRNVPPEATCSMESALAALEHARYGRWMWEGVLEGGGARAEALSWQSGVTPRSLAALLWSMDCPPFPHQLPGPVMLVVVVVVVGGV